MFNLTRYQVSHVFNHEKLGLVSASTAAAAEESYNNLLQSQFYQNNTGESSTQTPNMPNPYSSQILDPGLLISTLFNCRNMRQIKQVHAHVTASGMLLHNLTVANKLLYKYAQLKDLVNSYALFDRMIEKDPVSWSVMIGGLAKVGDYQRCFETFRELLRCGVQPDNYNLPLVIRACRDSMGLNMGRLVHGIVSKCGLCLDDFVCATLLDMYAKCGEAEDAERLFDEMPYRDLVTWTAMIGGFAESGNAGKSLALFDRMREEGVLPDKIAMVTIVNACAKLGAISKARFIHDYICRNRFPLDVILGTAVIDMFAKCGSVDSAREIFDSMQQRNVISWSAMIATYGYHGQGRKALDLFPMMLNTGIVPNRITFVALLYACSHSGLVEDGLQIFSMMWEKYGVSPDLKHYTCMVDLLGRSGRFDEALRLIDSMPVKPDEGLWCALLGACRIHKRVDLAEKAAKPLLESQSHNPGHYILLSNVYANAGRWKDVAKMRILMTKRRLKKIPGYTWIEVDNVIYRFSAADETHPKRKEIYDNLKNLYQMLELAGYVPDTSSVLHDVDEEVKLDILSKHSEKLAISLGLIATPEGTPVRITKNLRVCDDCHTFSKLVSAVTRREIIVRDANRFHHFKEGACSCSDYW